MAAESDPGQDVSQDIDKASAELRTFPLQLPLRSLEVTSEQNNDIPETIRETWNRNIVNSDVMHLDIAPNQLRDLVFYGATELRKENRSLIDPSIFRTCVRWMLTYQKTWLGRKNDTDLKLLALLWNDLLHHGPQTGDQRHWFLDHATDSYQQFYEASRTDNNFKVARILGGIMLGNASTPRQLIQAHKRLGRLYGSHIDRFHSSDKNWRPVVNTCIHHLNLGIKKLVESPDIEPLITDKDIWEYCAWALDKRYEVAYQDADILLSIDYYKVLIEKDRDNIRKKLVWSDKLARAYWQRFGNLKIVGDAKLGIAEFEKILDIEPENPYASTGLAELLRSAASAQVLSNAERRDITDRSINLLENCIANTADDHPNLPNRLGKLSDALVERYHYDATIEDLEMAIALQHTAIELYTEPSNALAFHHKQLSDKYVDKFQNTKSQADIDSAISNIQKCIEMTSKLDETACIRAKLGLTYAYAAWYSVQHQLEHLQLGISSGEEALEQSRNSGWRPTSALEILARLYLLRFQRLQGYDDAAQGIKYIRETIHIYRSVAGRNNFQEEAGCLSILAKLMRARAEVYRAQEDMDEAVRAGRDALKITDIEHKKYLQRSIDFSYNLTLRFKTFWNPMDIREATNVLDVASQSLVTRRAPATATERGLLENQYGIVCIRRQESASEVNYSDEALEHFQAAMNADPSHLPYSQNYATMMAKLARQSGRIEDSIKAVQAYQLFVQNVQKYAPETVEALLPNILENMALLCMDKAKTNILKSVFMPMSIRLLEELCQAKLAKASTRLWAARERSGFAAWQEMNFEIASAFVNFAAALLPEVLNPGLNRTDQLRLAAEESTLPGFTLAFNIMAGHEISEILQIFEQLRGVLWNRLLNENDELASLENVNKELASQFRELHKRLSVPRKPASSMESNNTMVFDAADSYSDALQYTALLKQIRMQPGLKDFLLISLNLDEISSYAAEGAIVVVNCANNYSHAVIVTSSQTTVLRLQDYSNAFAKQLHEKLKLSVQSLKQQEEALATELFNRVCLSLWTAVAKPVLDKLDELLPENSIRQWKSKPVHRIWWLANQWMNVLPIHAAGDYSETHSVDRSITVLDRSISSYIPSFGALKYARKNNILRQPNASDPTSTNKPSALLLALPHIAGQADLPHASEEALVVEEKLVSTGVSIHKLAEESTSKKNIVSALKTSSIAHFICHGQVDVSDPLKSQLLIADSHRSPLDVRTLIRTSMSSCALVYLSVCSAAASETLPLLDEGLHIAGAFLMAGVPHVIGTRWELADQLAITVAKRFYTGLSRVELNKSNDDKFSDDDSNDDKSNDDKSNEDKSNDDKSNDDKSEVKNNDKLDDQNEKHFAGLDVSRSAEVLRDVLLTVRAEGVPAILYSSYVHYGM